MAILTLSCGAALVPESAYFVIVLSRTNIPSGDLPPVFETNLSLETYDHNLANWFFPPINLPSHGVWDSSTTYAANESVASAHYSPGIALTYKSLINGNIGNDPDNFTGEWTCLSGADGVTNSFFTSTPFGYRLAAIPTNADLAAATWSGILTHSLFWTVAAPGDVVDLQDVYVRVNFRLSGSILVPGFSRPAVGTILGGGSQGIIVNPGINAEFQCWHTSGLSDAPSLLLSSFSPVIPTGGGILGGGQVGVFYSSAFVASGGTPPYTYSLIGGSFPDGVTLNTTTGVISGIPLNSGNFSFTGQVTDSAAGTATVTCGMLIIPAPIPPPIPIFPFEFYEMQTPEDVETLPVPKKYDQLGPMRFDKIGKIFGLRIRLIATGDTETIPFKIYGDDSESLPNLNSPFYIGEFPVVSNVDKVYEIQLPKSVNTDVFRLALGPVENPFHRYDVLIKVHTSGLPGQARWIPVR